PELAAHRRAVDREDTAVVALDQHADVVAAEGFRQATRAGPDPALPPEGDGPGPGADGALLDGAGGSALEGADDVLGGDRAGADIVQLPIVRLTDHGVDRSYVPHPRLAQEPFGHGVGRLPDAEGAGQEDRRLELAQLADLRKAEE